MIDDFRRLLKIQTGHRNQAAHPQISFVAIDIFRILAGALKAGIKGRLANLGGSKMLFDLKSPRSLAVDIGDPKIAPPRPKWPSARRMALQRNIFCVRQVACLSRRVR